jgi:putative ABC transport system ATP-binding protein
MMIGAADMRFHYPVGDFRLHVPELSVEKGATVAVIGPSGTGKTTLLNLIAGITTPSSGRIVTNGVDLTRLADAARRDFRIRHIGLVFQEFELLSYLDVLDNILLPYRINSSLKLDRQTRERAVHLAEWVGIEDKLGRYVSQLSQGERQRVAICRALLPQPVLVLADEPTGNLDPANKDRVLDILFDVVHKNATTLVAVTHDHDVLGRFDRTIEFADLREAAGDSIRPTKRGG